jgi:hypothetical protein
MGSAELVIMRGAGITEICAEADREEAKRIMEEVG